MHLTCRVFMWALLVVFYFALVLSTIVLGGLLLSAVVLCFLAFCIIILPLVTLISAIEDWLEAA